MTAASQDPLASPVGALLYPIEGVQEANSLAVALHAVRHSGLGAVAVLRGTAYVGILDERGMATALAVDAPLTTAVVDLPVKAQFPVTVSDSGAHALRRFVEDGVGILPVVDSEGQYVGLLTPSLLGPRYTAGDRPKLVGGMATPVGVYLTTGSLSAGSPYWAVVLAGVQMFSSLAVGMILAQMVLDRVPALANSAYGEPFSSAFGMLFFLLALRFSPLAGFHGAEHMVIHAIEQGEELTLENVRRMPRVHPRCGTNIAVAAFMFLGISELPWIPDHSARVILALLITFFSWRQVGGLVQFLVTTKTPNDYQIAKGIEAGKEIISKYQSARVVNVGLGTRLYRSGLFHVMLGSFIVMGIVSALLLVLPGAAQWGVHL